MIAVMIQTHNRLAKLQRLLQNPLFQADLDAQGATLFVNAQGCTDGTNLYLKGFLAANSSLRYVERLIVWVSWQDPGVIAGRCRMLDYMLGRGLAPHDVLVYLDDDVEVTAPGWLSALVDPIRDNPRVAVTGAFGVVVQPDWSDYVLWPPSVPCAVDVVSQSHTAVAAHLFLAGVEFDLSLGFVWHEDTVLCMEAHARGYDVWYVGPPETIGLHHDPHRKDREAYDRLYWRNWDTIKARYAGQGLILAEMAVEEADNG